VDPVPHRRHLGQLLHPGLLNTLKAAAASIVLAGAFGLVFGMGRLSQNPRSAGSHGGRRVLPVGPGAGDDVLRLLLLRFQQRGLPQDLNPLAAVVTGLTLYNGSVVAELLRSGVGSLPKGQTEAGCRSASPAGRPCASVLLPQAITAMLPALVSQLVVILKDTALGLPHHLPRAAQQVPADRVLQVQPGAGPHGHRADLHRHQLRPHLRWRPTSSGALANRGRATIPSGAAGPAPVDTEPIADALVDRRRRTVLQERYRAPGRAHEYESVSRSFFYAERSGTHR
jgi:ABC-type amino acid transport system permease subunit